MIRIDFEIDIAEARGAGREARVDAAHMVTFASEIEGEPT